MARARSLSLLGRTIRFVCSILLLLGGALPIRATEGVILLHGLCRSSGSMSRIEDALVKAGYYVENIDYPSRSASIEQLSDEAIERALFDPKMQSCSRVHFVTHSMGGILVRSYFSRHSVSTLGRVVMIGPPNKGSELVDKLGGSWLFRKITGSAGGELGTGLNSTPNKIGPVEFDLAVIAGDRSINWINSILIEGKDDGKVSLARSKADGMKEFLVVHVPHPFLIRNKSVIEATLRFLKDGKMASGV